MRTPTSSGQRRFGRRLLATALAFGLLATTGCSTLQSIRALTESSTSTERGEVTETDDATETEEAAEGSTDIDVFSIRVGDCIETSLGDDSGETETLPVIPCNEPHGAEIFHAFDIDESEFPGQDAVISIADEGCYNEFEGFIGMSYDYSEVYMSSMYPTQWTWLDGDREVLCIVYIPDEQVTGTLEGANR